MQRPQRGPRSKLCRLLQHSEHQILANVGVRGDDTRAMNHGRCVRTLRRFLGEERSKPEEREEVMTSFPSTIVPTCSRLNVKKRKRKKKRPPSLQKTVPTCSRNVQRLQEKPDGGGGRCADRTGATESRADLVIADKGSPSPTTQTTPGIDERLVKREVEDKTEYKDRQIDG